VGESVEVETALADRLWLTWADANQVESVLLNLAITARDAMPEGGRLIIQTANVCLANVCLANVCLDGVSEALETGVEAGEYAMLAVTDTGTGMPPAILERAFEPFFTTKPVGQGTGLGLSQLYGFARQSRGIARIESREGRGTSVKLYLPRHHVQQKTADEPAVRQEVLAECGSGGRRLSGFLKAPHRSICCCPARQGEGHDGGRLSHPSAKRWRNGGGINRRPGCCL
jgi:K+-sensing histidine kinase KdpD